MRRLAALLAVGLLAACGGAATPPRVASPTPTAAAALAVGPGPQKVYTVQPQPPAGSCRTRGAGTYPLPDPVCTPGAVSPAVTQANIHQTICVKGYTATIRPPLAVTGPEKRANAKAYGGRQNLATAELDHLVPLGLGGDPNDPRNLWVEPNDNPHATSTRNAKDRVEAAAMTAVCDGRLPLGGAQAAMATDWPQLGRQLGVLK